MNHAPLYSCIVSSHMKYEHGQVSHISQRVIDKHDVKEAWLNPCRVGLIILEIGVHGVKNLGSLLNDERQETLEDKRLSWTVQPLAKLPAEFSHISDESYTTQRHPDELHQLTKSKEIIVIILHY